MSDFTQPWWKPASLVSAESSCNSAGCRFRTLVSTECRILPDEHGVPQRKCERIFRKFKECPGRPAEVVERVEESTTEPNFKQDSKDWHPLREHGSAKVQREVIPSEMGQLLEEVLAAFEKDFFLEDDPSWEAGNLADRMPRQENDELGINNGFFGKWFKRKSKPRSTNPGSATAPQYGDYANDFQEV
ncbi:hypothetical protein BSKO_04924 [Bryopsis sp. KO-2023]|nr:hypothetical protein BSKO_04924 [Bryopsis sp. KO-2023]